MILWKLLGSVSWSEFEDLIFSCVEYVSSEIMCGIYYIYTHTNDTVSCESCDLKIIISLELKYLTSRIIENFLEPVVYLFILESNPHKWDFPYPKLFKFGKMVDLRFYTDSICTYIIFSGIQ